MKTKNKEAAMLALKKAEYDSAIVYCHQTKYYFIEEGGGGMIRNFERLVATKENGKIEIEKE